MSNGPCAEHLEPGRDRGSRSGPGRESPGAVHGILWKIRLSPPFVVICRRFFESRAHAFYLNPSASLCMLSVEAQAQLTPLTPLTPLTAWLKGRVLGQHTCPYGLRPRSTLTPLTPLTPLTAWLKGRYWYRHWNCCVVVGMLLVLAILGGGRGGGRGKNVIGNKACCQSYSRVEQSW